MPKPGRKFWFLGAAALAAAASVLMLSAVPLTTRQGVNFHVSQRSIPLYVKAIDFLHRHYQYQRIAGEITAGCSDDRARALAVFAWTRQNIRKTPDGWPIIDDHILHIIIRGYGVSDQMADVFSTLCTYAGVPAFWQVVNSADSRRQWLLSFARVDGKWVVFDVANAIIFKNEQGELASLDELKAHPAWVASSASGVHIGGAAYDEGFSRIAKPAIPNPLRSQLQMPLPRLWYQLQQAAGRRVALATYTAQEA